MLSHAMALMLSVSAQAGVSATDVPFSEYYLGTTRVQYWDAPLGRKKAKSRLANARARGIVSLAGAGGCFFFGITAMATNNGYAFPSTMFGGLSLTTYTVTGLFGLTGANEVRSVARAAGTKVPSTGMTVGGLVTGGLTVINGSVLVAIGFVDDIPNGLIASCVTLGVTSGVLFGVDALSGAAMVESRLSGLERGMVPERPRVVVRPTTSVGRDHALLGLSGSF